MSDKKYSLKLTASSGEEALTIIDQPNMTYLELVIAQAVIHKAFTEAGFSRAVLKFSEKIPAEVLSNFGIDPEAFARQGKGPKPEK